MAACCTWSCRVYCVFGRKVGARLFCARVSGGCLVLMSLHSIPNLHLLHRVCEYIPHRTALLTDARDSVCNPLLQLLRECGLTAKPVHHQAFLASLAVV